MDPSFAGLYRAATALVSFGLMCLVSKMAWELQEFDPVVIFTILVFFGCFLSYAGLFRIKVTFLWSFQAVILYHCYFDSPPEEMLWVFDSLKIAVAFNIVSMAAYESRFG